MCRCLRIWIWRTTDEVSRGSLANGVTCQSKAYFCYCWLLQLQNRFILIFKNVFKLWKCQFWTWFFLFWHIPLSKTSSAVVKLFPDCIRGHFLIRTGGKWTRFCSPLWYLQILSQNPVQHLALIWLAPEWIGVSIVYVRSKVGGERHYCHLQSIHFCRNACFFWLLVKLV